MKKIKRKKGSKITLYQYLSSKYLLRSAVIMEPLVFETSITNLYLANLLW